MGQFSEIVHSCRVPTAVGDFLAHFSASGLARLEFPGDYELDPRRKGSNLSGSCKFPTRQTLAQKRRERRIPRKWRAIGTFCALSEPDRRDLARSSFSARVELTSAPSAGEPVRTWAAQTASALEQILVGTRAIGDDERPPLDLSGWSPFRIRVWAVLTRIPRGETRSYGDIARELSLTHGARAVGGACGANAIPVLIPCHRVVAAAGLLGGFSAGLPWKRTLLAREHIPFYTANGFVLRISLGLRHAPLWLPAGAHSQRGCSAPSSAKYSPDEPAD